MDTTRELPPDEVLLQRLRDGDEQAFAVVVDTWSGGMHRLALSFVSTKASAEEVVQDTWLAVIRAIARFEGRSSLKTWVYRILVNTAKARGTKEHRTVPFASLRPEQDGRAPLIVIMGVGLVAALGLRTPPFGAPTQTTPTFSVITVPGLNIGEVGSWAEIHPARTPAFCLAEGRDRTQLHTTAIAAQQPCGQAASPRVFVDPVGDDHAVQIQWHHPKTGVGCLTVLNEGVGQDLLEPRDDCDDDNSNQMFTLEPIGSPDAETGRLRIRPVSTGQCLGLRDQDTIAGTEIVQERCSGAADQEFLLNALPPP